MHSQEKEEIFMEDEKLTFSMSLPPPPLLKPIKKTSNLEKTFEVTLTYEQYQVIKMKLPKGYYLKEKKKKKKMSFSITPPPKKVHFESNISIPKQPQIPKKTSFLHKTEMIPHIPTNRPNPPDISILNEPIPDQEYRKISSALKNFKASNANDVMKKCYKILLILKIHPKVKPFLEPVDPIALKIPDYPMIVKEPMDLGTIERKLLESKYKDQVEFEQDVHKVWNNSLLYNPKSTKIHGITLEMKYYFEQLLIESKGEKRREPGLNIDRKIDKLLGNLENMYKKDQSNFFGVFRNKVKKMANIPMNMSDRQKLMQNLIQINKVEMAGVLNIINEGNFEKNHEKKELELDLRTLNNEKLRMLEGYLDFLEKNRKQRIEDKQKKGQRDEMKKKGAPPTSEIKTSEDKNKTFSSTNSSFITNSNVSEEEIDFK